MCGKFTTSHRLMTNPFGFLDVHDELEYEREHGLPCKLEHALPYRLGHV